MAPLYVISIGIICAYNTIQEYRTFAVLKFAFLTGFSVFYFLFAIAAAVFYCLLLLCCLVCSRFLYLFCLFCRFFFNNYFFSVRCLCMCAFLLLLLKSDTDNNNRPNRNEIMLKYLNTHCALAKERTEKKCTTPKKIPIIN